MFNRLWKWLGGLALLFLVFLFFLPSILGSRWIVDPLLANLQKDKFKIQIEKTRLSWLSAVQIEGVTIEDSSGAITPGKPFAKVRKIQCSRGLIGFLLNGRNLGRIEIRDIVVDLELLKDGTSLERLSKSLQNKEGNKTKPKLDLEMGVRNLSVVVHKQGEGEPLVVVPPFSAEFQYQALDGSPNLDVKPTTILDQVKLTPELLDLGLTYGIPLLAKAAWFDGKISLATGDIHVPLDDPKSSSGAGTFTLHEVKCGPEDPGIVKVIDFLSGIRGKAPIHELTFVNNSVIDISLEKRRVTHKGLAVGLPRVDQRLIILSSGSVGLDDRSLAIELQIPVPVEQLAKRDSVKQLGVPSLSLPITGTLDDPKIRWDVLRQDSGDMLAAIREQLGNEAPKAAAALQVLEGLADGQADEVIGAAADFVKQLRDRRKAEKESGKPDEPAKPLREKLRDLFRK